ncbi:hypothetical protein AGMMS49992_22950 [Clostridia bacterium]|nr:hypothetical protein AGMMS49992_22950 [Clostridia bacterium]
MHLLKATISATYINPGDTLWVTLHYQGLTNPSARFFIDMEYGHQRRPENRSLVYTAEGEAFPLPLLWREDDIIAVTIPWRVASDWSGTYHIYARITSADYSTLARYYVGDIDTSWNLGRPWVDAQSKPQSIQLAEPRKSSNIMNLSKPIMNIRNRETNQRVSVLFDRLTAEYVVNGKPVVTCAIHYNHDGNKTTISLTDLFELEPYELLSVTFPALASLPDGYLVTFDAGGRLIPIDMALPICYHKKYNTRNAAALYDDNQLTLVESAHMDSWITTGVVEVNGSRRGIIGGDIVARVPADKPGLASIPVTSYPIFIIETYPIEDDVPGWQTAARLWRRGLSRAASFDFYKDAYIYKQLATYGPQPDDSYRSDAFPTTQNLFRTTTFAQIKRNALALSAMTDGMRQILYIAGWQQGGFDTSYPEPYDAEPRCGGMDGLRDALSTDSNQNIHVSLHDNFDDIDASQFPDYPHTAIDERGEPWRGWLWAGGLTHIMGFGKYVKSGAMIARVNKMFELLPLLPLQHTYHIDVLTAETCRYDFDTRCPSSAEDSFSAKMAIVSEFNSHGVDVTSEMLTHRAVGRIGYALHTRTDPGAVYYPGERFIPLDAMVYHGTIGYSAPSQDRRRMLWGLLIGAHTFYEEDITGETSISRYYLQHIPAVLLAEKTMTAFEDHGAVKRAWFGINSYVDADLVNERYTVCVDGAVVGKDFATLFEGPKGYQAYSLTGRLDGLTMPESLRGVNSLLLTPLSPDGAQPTVVVEIQKTEDNAPGFTIPPSTPVRIERE